LVTTKSWKQLISAFTEEEDEGRTKEKKRKYYTYE
jgi:hypothetical protein